MFTHTIITPTLSAKDSPPPSRGTMSATSLHAAPPPFLSPTPPRIHRIIKLGGAAITHKTQLETPNLHVIHTVAQHVAQAFRQASLELLACTPGGDDDVASGSSRGIVVVHGAGSFGHHQACQYGVVQGWNPQDATGALADQRSAADVTETQADYRSASDPTEATLASGHVSDPGAAAAATARVKAGFALTRASVMKLNGIIVDALLAEGLPAVGLSPFSSGWVTSGRAVVQDGCGAVQACLEAGLLPVIHGDCVLDTQLGCTVLSGDTVMRRLAEVLGADSATFLTNVAGVFDRPPEEVGARLLDNIAVQIDGSWHVPGIQLATSSLDATGGIATKVEEAAVIAALGTAVAIAQAGTEAGRLACHFSPAQLTGRVLVGPNHPLRAAIAHSWEGTIVCLSG